MTSTKSMHKLINEGTKREGQTNGIEYNGWKILSKKAPICNSQDIDKLQGDLGIPLPEMIFGNNEVKLSHEDGFEILFRAKDALELVDKTSESNKHIKVAYASEWGKKSAQNHEEIKDVIKPYDWTYSTSYQGTSANEFSDTEKCIDVDRLKQMEPILFYDENILFEDELADNGTATLTTRLRVMPSCFFLLLRFFLRVDDVLFRINDTRIYHQFGTNHIIREYSSKEEHYNAVRSRLPKMPNEDISLLTDPNWVSSILPTDKQFHYSTQYHTLFLLIHDSVVINELLTSTMASLKVMTFNVRIDGPQTDDLPPIESATQTLGGEQRWALRKWKVADTVLTYEPDIVGFQEPYHNQVLDLADLLKSEYDWVGCGRNDGKEEGEYSPIFYKRDVVELDSNKTIWLSKTPDQPGSKDWDANQTRIANFATFKVKGNEGKKFQVINTHFDNSGATARRESAIILLKELAAIFDPVVLMGDLNSTEDDGAYLELTCGRYTKKKHDTASQLIKLNDNHTVEEAKQAAAPVRTGEGHITLPTHIQFRRGKLDPANLKPLNERHGFVDARYELESRQDGYQGLSGPYGHYLTFTGFGNQGEDPPSRLDYILLANNVKATRYAVLENKYEDGLLISDHRPVMATVKF